MNKFDREKEYFTAYRNNPLDINSFSGNYISSIIPDKNNILWIGTGRGLNKLNTVTLENKIYSSDSGSKNFLSNNYILSMQADGNELFEFTGIAFSVYGINEDFRKITLSVNSKRNLIYIFKEGMNNILKYADCTKVDLSFHLYDEDLEILLEDNGVGFDVNKCSKGYGLKDIFARSKQININVNITSEEKSGTKITLKTKTSNLLVTS